MNKKYYFIIAAIVFVFLVVGVIYPTLNYKTWGNNEWFYIPPMEGQTVVCDEWLWQPPQNCRVQ